MQQFDTSPAPGGSAHVEASFREFLRSRKMVPGRVSVIIPVYQGVRFILGAVRSALRQTYHDVEVLVVDDGSTDGTASRLAEVADPRLTLLQQSNQGLSAARNTGLARASGEYIALLDADDRWFPEKIETEVRTLETSARPVGMVYSWYYAVDGAGRLLHRSRPYQVSGDAFETMLGMDDLILPSASFFHRRVFEEVGGFDVGSHHEDRVLFLKAAKTFPVWPTRRYLVVYRHSIEGLGRRQLTDFEGARRENLSVVDYLRPHLSVDQADALRDQQLRSLYCRFLMHGFNESAGRLLPEVEPKGLRRGMKGWIAWVNAKSGVNLMYPLRLAIQRFNRTFGQRGWRETLSRAGLDLEYGVE